MDQNQIKQQQQNTRQKTKTMTNIDSTQPA